MNQQNMIKEQNSAMSEAYWQRWNDAVQRKIDDGIEKNRKADACWTLEDAPQGTEVQVEQISHSFIFGAHIFNYDQLGSDERNEKYKALFGTFFNSATIAFYWKKFELEEGRPRFKAEYRDSAEYWNSVKEPKLEAHWRRPASDPVVAFCESKGIRLHGHPLTWGNCTWHYPEWLQEKLPEPYRSRLLELRKENPWGALNQLFSEFTPEQIEQLVPEYVAELNLLTAKRIQEIALHYRGRIHSWDVVNESAWDFGKGVMHEGSAVCQSTYGLMPGDYTYRSFKIADSVFPKNVKLNINDYNLTGDYVRQIADLRERGCKIDIMGAQMHLFNPQTCLDIADGSSENQSPDSVFKTMDLLSTAGLPIHLSEITITAPNNDERGQAIQAVIARNLYRLWFSVNKMMGITWWNVVDDCGAPGEPSVSGLFSRDMEPKPAWHALNGLINGEWKTRLELTADKNSAISFRGFRGTYLLRWRDASGAERSKISEL